MCGREPNFELSDAEKHELRKLKWEDFLAVTRSAITNKSKPPSPFNPLQPLLSSSFFPF